MYVDDCIYKRNGKRYRRTLLRTSYRENGKVKHKTIANISHCSDIEIEAMRLALRNKNNFSYLKNLSNGKVLNGKMVGSVSAIYQVAKNLGITKILGNSKNGLLILWLVIARLIDQGSRLSAVRLSKTHAGCETIGIDSLCEDDLYDAMDWLFEKRYSVEKRLIREWEKTHTERRKNHIFLYDVTSSYVEGEKNELSEYGYNRDKKRGKKQIVYGLLTDEAGDPLSIEAFRGNTSDNKTVSYQIEKLKSRFGCKYVTLVGDKGMLKSAQIEELNDERFNYITSITKSQIEKLLKEGTFQLDLFEDELCEVEDRENDIRYILRRNPARAFQLKHNRDSKISSIRNKIKLSNIYLSEHSRAKVSIQIRDLMKYVEKLKLKDCIDIKIKEDNRRELEIEIYQEKYEELSRLDGCYVIKTDLPQEIADKGIIHSRYKSLSKVERAFRCQKSNLAVRPVYVRKRASTISHLIIVMLAYKIERYLGKAWSDLDVTVQEGLKSLDKISSVLIEIGESELIRVPEPDKECKELLKRINVTLPRVLPNVNVNVATRKKLKRQS